MKRIFLLSLVALFLTGCSGTTPLTVTEEIIDSAGNVVGTTTTTVADASVAKEQAVHETLREDSENYHKALSNSGSKMVTKTVGYQEMLLADGTKAYLPLTETTASFVEAPKRNMNLPTKPSEHPVWRFGEAIVEKGLWAFGIHEVAGVFESLVDRPQYNFGDNANIQNSFDNAGTSQDFTGAEQYQDEVIYSEPSELEPYIDSEGNCMVSDSCSCDSYYEGGC